MRVGTVAACLAMLGPGTALAQGAFEGAWLIVASDGALAGETVGFSESAIEGPPPLGCEGAAYEIVALPPRSLFQGALGEGPEAAEEAERLGLAPEAETLRVTCDTGVFDYHLGRDGLMIMLDGVIYTLARPS